MEMQSLPSKSILRRRDQLSSKLQAGVDGLVLILIALALIRSQIGFLTPEYSIMLLMLLGILAVVFDQYAIYRSNVSFTRKAYTLFKAWTLSFLILLFIGFVTKQSDTFSRLLIAQLYVAGLGSHIFFHFIFYRLQKTWLAHRTDRENALVLGQGDLANYLSMKINDNPWMGQRLVGAVSVDGTGHEETLEFQNSELEVLGSVTRLPEIIKEYDVSTVYIVTPLQGSKVLEDVYFTLLDNHIAVHWIPDIFSLRLVNHSLNEIAGIPVLTLSETPFTGLRLVAKSLEDRILSALILILIAPLLLLIAIVVKLDSRGPAIYRQERAGWNGKTFRIWKFRSMYVDQPEAGVLKQAEKGDARVTKIGAFIRRTSLDELPQLINVLRGDMSLVGPRPHAIQHDEEYSRRIADYFARQNIKPGITGLAQVRGYRGETNDVSMMVQRVESDIEYINTWSLWLDLTIMLRTTTAFTGKGAY
jgi:putative colanic acid biosynthesis UDP-glucose lipid carrier transferase